MRRLTLGIMLIVAVLVRAAAPDFSYPATVRNNSRADVSRALASGDGPLAVRSMMDYVLASSAIDADSIDHSLAFIDSVALCSSSVDVKALCSLLRARVLVDIYGSDRYNFDRRNTPDDVLPASVKEWNGVQFRSNIVRAVDYALATVDKSTKINSWIGITTLDVADIPQYPLLYDFIAYRSIDILNGLNGDKGDRIQQDIYSNLVRLHAGDAPALINARVASLQNSHPESLNDSLMAISSDFSSSPYGGEALLAVSFYAYPDMSVQECGEWKRLVSDIRGRLSRFSGYKRNNCLKNKLNELVRPMVTVKVPSVVSPSERPVVKVGNMNSTTVRIEIFRVPESVDMENETYRLSRADFAVNRFATVKVDVPDSLSVPFVWQKDVELPLLPYGRYVVVPVADGCGDLIYDSRYTIVRSTDMMGVSAAFGRSNWVSVLNMADGSPVSKATVSGQSTAQDKRWTRQTDASGEIALPDNSQRGRIYIAKGRDRYASPVYLAWSNNDAGPRSAMSVTAFTSLPLYHPGDSVDYCGVLQSAYGSSSRPLPGVRVLTIVYNPNNQPTDTIAGVTDEFGRVTGRVFVPDDGSLTGNWSLTFVQDGTSRRLGNRSFMVSDYRLPEYVVDITSLKRGDGVRLEGTAATYSGFPVAGGEVALCITASPRYVWRWSASETVVVRDTVSTDASGIFKFSVPDSAMAHLPWPDAILKAEVAFTAPAGDVVTASRRFTVGRPYELSVTFPASADVTEPVAFRSVLADLDGQRVSKDLSVKIFRDGKSVMTAITNTDTLNLSSLPSGRYGLVFQTADTALAAPTDTISTVLYRSTDSDSPVPSQLVWTPVQSVVTDDSGHASVTYALGSATGWMHYLLATDSVMIDRGMKKSGSGMHTFDVALPDGIDNATLNLWAAGNGRTENIPVKISRPRPAQRLSVEIESMRDRLVPGSKERWNVHVSGPGMSVSRAALIMNIFAKSVTALHPHSIDLSALTANSIARFSLNSQWPGWFSENMECPYKSLKCLSLSVPQFQTYGQSFYPVFKYHTQLYMSKAATRANGFYEDKAMAMADVEAEVSVEVTADGGAAYAGGTEVNDDTVYRESEVPLALFAPSLTTADDGSCHVSFTVPDANTTWRLLALAYNKDMTIGTLSHEMIASKPLMVRPNLPRFMRLGDEAEILSSVMNATDSTLVTTTVVETFDPLTRRLLHTEEHIDTIAPKSSAIIGFVLTANAEGLLGFRVKSSALGFTDGEQALLPVLPAAQPVIKSEPFYIPATDTLAVISRKKGANATVSLNTNPIWSVVTALPGLMETVDADATSAVSAIYGAAVSSGLISRESWLRDGLKSMIANPEDSALVSALSRNQQLKTLMLNQTPWINSAMSQTERMARLTLAMNPEEVMKTMDKAVSIISRLQLSGGGLAWREQYPYPSEWLTRGFICRVSQLKALGFMPSDTRLTHIVRRAVAYCDSLVAVAYKKDIKTVDFEYAVMRYRLADIPRPAAAERVSANTIEWVKANWKKLSLADKARAAMLLNHYGAKTEARQILDAIEQYAVTNKTLGISFPSLPQYSDLSASAMIMEAFKTIRPDSHVIDGIRQWLLLQKDTRDWGSSESVSQIVAAILLSTSPRASVVPDVTLQHDGKESPVDMHGYVSAVFDVEMPFVITVDKPAGEPVWGAVMEKSIQLPSKVKPHATPDLSISKRMLKQMSDGKWRETTEFEVGDIVEVSLTVKCDRTMDFVTIVDPRPAACQPVDQLPGYIYADGLSFYRENNDAATNIFIDRLPRGTYVLSYRVTANNAGTYTSGIATVQSQYSPGETANSSAPDIHVISTNH